MIPAPVPPTGISFQKEKIVISYLKRNKLSIAVFCFAYVVFIRSTLDKLRQNQ